jgi:phosphate transport system substrate-binding protein
LCTQITQSALSAEELVLGLRQAGISNWAELGGDDAPIQMLLLEGSSLTSRLANWCYTQTVSVCATAERAESESQAAAVVASERSRDHCGHLSDAGEAHVLPIRQTCIHWHMRLILRSRRKNIR